MIYVAFFLGVVLALIGVVAIFKKIGGGEGKLKGLGIELSGPGPVVIFLAGAALTASGYGWALNQAKAETAEKVAAVAQKDAVASKTESVTCINQKAAIVSDAVKLDVHRKSLEQQNQSLINAFVHHQQPSADLLKPQVMTLPAALSQAIQAAQQQGTH